MKLFTILFILTSYAASIFVIVNYLPQGKLFTSIGMTFVFAGLLGLALKAESMLAEDS